ncbi:transcription-repair coupling factor [Glacieibacterium megasporae]|uniref:transcription-repair coupling factor n=1 Tax=Glacieibacterium megasporae TaxID=2835787 RepID=UPI001C1E7001|nr:transcription-repair coupling factor [Polymorphobacter megasporae]UAJ08646.1 transcription-repair coupling factor [Polymorphobacter megasporae]
MLDLKSLISARESLTLAGCVAGYQPWLMADVARAAKGRAVFIAADDSSARGMLDAVTYFAPEIETVYFPAWDCLPYDRASPSMRVSSDRLAALSALAAPTDKAQLLVTTVNAVLQRTLPPARIKDLTAEIKPGARIDRDKLAAMLTANGYVRTDTVFEAGEYAVRGGLLDLFAAGDTYALRLDFFGDEIETVRRFDPATQRTVETAKGFSLLPVNEVLLSDDSIKAFRKGYLDAFGATATGDPLYEAISDGRRLAGMEHWLPLFEPGLSTLFDYLGDGAVVVREAGTASAADARFEAIAEYHDNRKAALSAKKGSYRPLEPASLYLGRDEWTRLLAGTRTHLTSPFGVPDGTRRTIDCETTPPRDFTPERTAQSNVYEAVKEHIDRLRTEKRRIILASYSNGSRERLSGLLGDHGVTNVATADSWQEALGIASDGRVALTVLPLDHGFSQRDVAVLTEQDMLGDRLVRRRRSAKKADAFMAELAMLSPGDLLVHKDHGIGRYEGLFAVDIGATKASRAPHDCVMLSYGGGDKLYVPVENIDVLSRYGSESEGVALDKLGGVAWQARKAKMKDRIREIAGELMKTAAARALREADAAVPDAQGYAEFADRFPYTETEDQMKAIDDVLGDLASGRPMDRLICGDVGFGKTEVALRAAYAAAMSGQQVAIVCPTTLLARQHFAGFKERFAGLPIEIRQLSRLVTAGSANEARAGLADGTVDIVVGTHAILAKSIEFKRLGLVIVDEEQRFGVTAKERLKNLKTDVHVLTLTATPIPRTLQMALTGLRELSIIATPPVDRLAVRTYVMPWDEVVLREALLREHYRGGQSFFVTPKIAELPDIEEFLRKSVPEVTFVTAHGQMAPSEVEERMSAFYDRRYDVLLSTTIVESGLDIPSANTMIIHRSDRFGLAQLYQLRGRVGRSKTRAYAYMTTPADRIITETAEKRLQVLSSLDSLGAGFQLASHDLDIRGAGNLLGDEQSGHIREIGFELYQSMLEDAIVEARAGAAGLKIPEEGFSPTITIDAAILIPEDYVPDLNLRMALYRRLNELEDRAAIDGFAAEMIDRFGSLPMEVANLIQVIEIKQYCVRANIAKLDAGAKGALVTFQNDQFPNGGGLMDYVARLGDRAKFRPDQKLFVGGEWSDTAARLKGAMALAKGLARIAGGASVKPAEPKAVAKPKLASKPAPMPARPSVFKAKGRR